MKTFLLFLLLFEFPLLCPLPPDCVHDDVESANSLPDRILLNCVLPAWWSAFSPYLHSPLREFCSCSFCSPPPLKKYYIIFAAGRCCSTANLSLILKIIVNSQYLPNVFFLKGLLRLVLISICWPCCLCLPSQHGPWRQSICQTKTILSPGLSLSSRLSKARSRAHVLVLYNNGSSKFNLHPQ